jgi:hypothetical protein
MLEKRSSRFLLADKFYDSSVSLKIYLHHCGADGNLKAMGMAHLTFGEGRELRVPYLKGKLLLRDLIMDLSRL